MLIYTYNMLYMIISIHTLTITYMCYIGTICLTSIFTYYIIVYRMLIYLHTINLIAIYLFTIHSSLFVLITNNTKIVTVVY